MKKRRRSGILRFYLKFRVRRGWKPPVKSSNFIFPELPTAFLGGDYSAIWNNYVRFVQNWSRGEISEFKEHACVRAVVYEVNLYRQRETRPRSSAITHCRIYSRLLGSSASASAAPTAPALLLCQPSAAPSQAPGRHDLHPFHTGFFNSSASASPFHSPHHCRCSDSRRTF